MSATGRWQTIEHTGDLAIEVEAPSLESLFATAASALAGLLLGEESGVWEPASASDGGSGREVSVESPDREALLVDWLRELLYLQMSEEAVVARAEIGSLNEGRIDAAVTLRPLSREANIERELKAVTYHDAELGSRDGGWFARIVFDV